jgi:hypothetical protein
MSTVTTQIPARFDRLPWSRWHWLVIAPGGEDRWVAREVDAIEALLRVEGPLEARELKRRVEARFWGPGRFRAALAHGQREGRIRRVGRRRWEAVGR